MKKLNIKQFWAFLLATIICTSCFLLALNIIERKNEGKHDQFKVIKLSDLEDDPKVWGANYPLQYEDYLKNVDQVRTRYGGSEAIKHIPTSDDPREIVSQDKLIEDPRLVTLWAGYAFSKDFREERGHAFMLADQIYTLRQKFGQPGTCINCHGSTYKAMMELGEGDINKGFHKLNKLPYHEAKNHVNHPVSCIDCHDPENMNLRITRPAFVEGIKNYKKHLGINSYDVNKMASRAEMRVFVCAQCHVEYYFKGEEKTLTYPWNKGLTADAILDYYNESGFSDWSHKLTGAKVLKAQHPEFETYSQGIHARSGVSCVDCHMPYKRVGAIKITDHHINSPVLKVNRSCQTCHNIKEEELISRVNNIQDKHHEMKNIVFDGLISYIKKLETLQDHPQIGKLRKIQRDAQFYFDYIEAENSAGFHAPQESARIMIKSLNLIREGESILSK